MKIKETLFALALLAGAMNIGAQTPERSFYIDYGQNNVANQGYTTEGADANGHYWNNIHGKGTGAPDKAYPQTINMVAADNTATSCRLQLSARFSTNGYSNGGLQNPSADLLGDLAIESATQDYIFLEANQDYAIIRFMGLDLNKGYKFFSFGSRTDSGTPGREATFHFRGLNQWQGDHKMGGAGIGANGYNGNNNKVLESDIIFPDENGCIEMTIIKKTKGGMVHLNAQKVVEYSGVTRPELGYTLTRRMLFDFGERGKSGSRGDITSGADAQGNYWNNMAPQTSGTSSIATGTSLAVVTTANQTTDITLHNLVAFNANGYNNGGLNDPSAYAENLGLMAVASATQDYMYTENNGVATLVFQRLDRTKKYRFHIFGTRSDASNYRSTVLHLKGKTDWEWVQFTSGPGLGGDGINQNVRNVTVSDYISPDASGTIFFTFRQNTAPSCSFGHLSTIQLEEFDTNGQDEDIPAVSGDQTYYIDFGETDNGSRGHQTLGADANGHYWTNAYALPTERMYPRSFNLTNAQGVLTARTMTIGNYFHTNGMSGGGGLESPSASLLGDLAVATATEDYIHMEGAQNYSVIHFGGLDPEKGYRFYLFGSRQTTDDRAGYFELTGENRWKGEMTMSGNAIGQGYNGNNNKILTSDVIFPDRNGNIDLTLSKKYSGGMVYLNCMKIEEVSGQTRPNQELTLKQRMYFDFGETDNNSRGHQTTGADANGNYWNNITSGTSGSNSIPANKTFAVINSRNESTAASFVVVNQTYTNGINAGGNNSPSANDLGDLAVRTATEDYVFIDNGDARSFRISGLNTASCYRFYIYGTRNHTDNRCTQYTFQGQHTWVSGQTTSGYDVGGYGYPGNLRNILMTDYIYPDRSGNILITMQRVAGMAHISAMRIEEYQGGVRPEDPLDFSALTLSGNAEEASFKSVGNNLYEAFARLNAGTFTLTGTVDGDTVTLYDNGDGTFSLTGNAAFTVASDCVARVTVNAADNTVTVLPVTMNVRGNIGGGNPAIPYKGNGVFQGEVTLPETASQQWVDKTMYFALNNNDAFAIKRLQGAATRYALGEVEKGQSVENIYQNAGTYTITVDMRQMVYSISAPIDENRISVFGSSVANGQGAIDYKGYRYLYGQQLIARYNEGRSQTPFYTTNVSIGGNTTVNLLNRYDDLIRDFGRYVIFGLSLGNEGIHGAANQQAVFNQWRDNMLTLISKVRADGKIPMVMNNYTRGDYNADDYYYVKQLNLLIHEWDVPSTNVLGAIDKGNGQWADGYVSDTYHQNTAGHAEFMYAMVPSLFDAIKAGKPQPVRDLAQSMTVEAGRYIHFQPEETVHPFTVTVRLKGTEGQAVLLSQSSGSQQATVRVNANGTVTYTSPTGASVTSVAAINDDQWHYVTLTSYYAQRRTILYVDKAKEGEVAERLARIESVSLGDETHSRQVSELSFWRSGMTPEEISAVCDGRMLKSSLEIYAPLAGKDNMRNLAQSTNELSYGKTQYKEYERATADVFFTPDEGSAGFSTAENYDKILDGNTATKWCLNGGEGNSIYNIFHASAPIFVTGYKITTANDNSKYNGRNPKSWKLYGSTADSNPGKDDPSWEEIASVTNDTKLQDQDLTTYTFTLPAETAKAYQSFKWVITERKGGGNNVVQVSEFRPTFSDALVEVDPVARPRVTITDQVEKEGMYYGTYVATADVDFSGSQVSAYAGQLKPSVLHLEPLTVVPAGTALVVASATPGTYYLTKTADAALTVTNDLLGSDGSVTGNGSVYALAKNNGNVGFFQVEAGTYVPQGQAYFVRSGSNVEGFLFDDDGSTGLNGLDAEGPTDAEPLYNMAGQVLPHPVRGINVTRGKKMVIK